ncbi:hypothetical protein [Ectothiorhodospira variabilis]|uniref:hypothetical protein n=1 Tax=Ectothiorhodospira variabilis TaxID=505694 RepID=UPI001EFB48F4|nr:hypothetical protein [Ectothiorhodospira variabilis]MCG5498531.1 hypothetical protein [Ectothiorhodospira variabilis]
MLKRRTPISSRHRVGLYLEPRGLAVVVVDPESEPRPRLVGHAWVDGDDPVRCMQGLGEQVRALGLRRQPVHLVLPPHEYHCFLMEPPRVDANEIHEALRWKLADSLDFPADEAVIDTFPTPLQDKRGNGPHLLQVVATRAALIQERATRIKEAGLKLVSVDILEMALRNLSIIRGHNPDNDAQATVYIGPDAGLITVIRQHLLYLIRRLPVGYRQLHDQDPATIQHLVNEVRRSLDYYQRHVPGGAHLNLNLVTGFNGDEAVLEELKANQLARSGPWALEAPQLALDLEQVVELPADIQVAPDARAALLVAVGAALRPEDPA